jgi:hypothetical protein
VNPLRFICSFYAEPPWDLSKSYVVASSYLPRREPMLDLALFLGFALLCLYIAYERLSNRW